MSISNFLGISTTWPRLASMCVAGAGIVFFMAGCGGGSDSPSTEGGGGGVDTAKVFTDSFGRPVSTETMLTLPGREYLGSGDGGGGDGSGSAGGDGTGADGAPIANTNIRITDVDGRVITTSTDATGYFRVNIGGMKAPLVASVQRANNAWKSAMVSVIQKGQTNFYTINLTGLTDAVLSEVARSAGVQGGADAVTPAVLAQNTQSISQATQTVNNKIASQLKTNGLDPATFNPMTTAFKVGESGYDAVLESVTISKAPDGSTTIEPTGNNGGGGGTTTPALTGQWTPKVSFNGYTSYLPNVSGSQVPTSLPTFVMDYTMLARMLYTDSSYTISGSGNVVRIVGSGTDITAIINKAEAKNYAGCGSCGVGTWVTYDFDFSISISGVEHDQPIIPTTETGVINFYYERIS